MKSNGVRLLALLMYAAATQAQHFEDGLYVLSTQPTDGRLVETDGGMHYWIGEPADLDEHEITVFATDNFNERFNIRMRLPVELPDDALADGFAGLLQNPDIAWPAYALAIGDRTFTSHIVVFGISHVTVELRSLLEGDAVRAAELLYTDVLYRIHPGHKLLVRFMPQSQTVALGDPVFVEFEITNVGEQALAFDCCERDNFFFSAILRGEPLRNFGGMDQPTGFLDSLTLAPGESHRASLSLDYYFDLSRPGWYSLYGSVPIELLTTVDLMRRRVIWSDRVSGRFQLTIEQ